MRQYRAEIEPHGKKWRWQVKEKFYSQGEPVYKVVCINGMNRDYLEGKARTFEKAARAATDTLGALYARQKREALIAGYRQLGRVSVDG